MCISRWGAILVSMVILGFYSCGPKENTKIPINQVEPSLKQKGDSIASDIVESFIQTNRANHI